MTELYPNGVRRKLTWRRTSAVRAARDHRLMIAVASLAAGASCYICALLMMGLEMVARTPHGW